jgi:hypothetical protein
VSECAGSTELTDTLALELRTETRSGKIWRGNKFVTFVCKFTGRTVNALTQQLELAHLGFEETRCFRERVASGFSAIIAAHHI